MCSKFFLPVVSNIHFNSLLKSILAGWLFQQEKWVWQVVHKTEVSYISKPVPIALFGGCQGLHRNIMQNIVRKTANHAKKGELLEVAQGLSR